MNQRNEIEIQSVGYKVKCLDSNSIFFGETGKKLKTTLDKHKQNAYKDDESKIY